MEKAWKTPEDEPHKRERSESQEEGERDRRVCSHTGNSFGTVGAYDEEDPPVPIPNTVVKLLRADNTWLETAWKDKSAPTQAVAANAATAPYSSLAQLVEHAAVNRRVVGSSPTGGAKKIP